MAEGLPSGYIEVVSTDKIYETHGLGWVKDGTEISLKLAKFDNGIDCYLGSAIGNCDKLKKLADEYRHEDSRHAREAFYAQLPVFVERGHHKNVFMVERPNTDGIPVYYIKSSRDLRTYFVRDVAEDGKPVIIRVATCYKAHQKPALRVVTITG